MAQVLIIDDQDRYIELCRRAIPEHDYLGPARSWSEARALLRKRNRVEMVLLDVHFDIPEGDLVGLKSGAEPREVEKVKRDQGVHILRELRQGHPDLPVILMTSRDDLSLERAADELAVQEYTYFLDDEYIDVNALRAQMEGIARARRGLEREGPIFWGRSMAMRRIRSRLLTLARGRLPIILGGATGTGKSLIARHFIHPRSGRKGRFVAVDLSTIPSNLMAAHLFGSVRGSFTGSIADRKGAFEEADGGTLFLDEIGNLSHDAQKMLLTVLQEGMVTRLGDVRERRVDVKVIVATNEDLPAMVREGSFRSDLHMRLNPACTVELPPLSERRLDLPRLIEFCCERALSSPAVAELYAELLRVHSLGDATLKVFEGDTAPAQEEGVVHLLFPKRTMALFKKHGWPGNLREFGMTVENALVFTFTELVQMRRVERPDLIQVRPKLVRDLLRTTQELPEAPAAGWKLEVGLRPQETLNKCAADVERQYFTALYLSSGGDFSEMARILLADEAHARKVQLRFNQLGLKVRELSKRLA
ncbi:MAG: sigma-54-dependent Fis family transcriptional regulator [Proteobacteria bacterium]|nr:sigma-54-dependent Fis family transcriptional regulator [Pseudomonadota bacterium]MCP4919334.1 sigma-54-dependent Fis family transcriptional regulator [Pseudomonadota bacterium]